MAERKRYKTAKAVEPNQGTQRALAKKLRRMQQTMINGYTAELLQVLRERGGMAQDADDVRFPQRPLKWFETAAAAAAARWMIKARFNAESVSRWFCSKLARDTTGAQKRAMQAAGISPDYIKTRWTVPVVRSQYMSAQAAAGLPKHIEDMTSLITRMSADNLAKVQAVIAEGISKGVRLKDVEDTLRGMRGFDDARAKRVALDQSIKVNSFIQRENSAALGIKEAIWIHVPGMYTSRKSHIRMNGHKFNLAQGMYDPEVKRYVHCGELPFCRCICRSIIPDELK